MHPRGVPGPDFRTGARELEPRRHLEPREDLAGLHAERLRFARPIVRGEPGGVVRLGLRQEEHQPVLAEDRLGRLEALLDAVFVPPCGGEEGPVAGAERPQKRRPLAGR